jgi:MFS family permease
VAVLIAVRFVLGLGESVAILPPTSSLPPGFRRSSQANGWVFGGVGLGSGTAPPLVAFIIYNYGRYEVFYVSAAIGLIIAAIWAGSRATPQPNIPP